jgi:hypothetical protein
MAKLQMTPKEFVREFSLLKQNYLRQVLSNDEPALQTTALLQRLALTSEQKAALPDFLDTMITDILYTVLLGLDGETQIGNKQMVYTVFDEQGSIICDGLGDIEAYAYQEFYSK